MPSTRRRRRGESEQEYVVEGAAVTGLRRLVARGVWAELVGATCGGYTLWEVE